MALRAVSVVNLEQTIRASFDRRVEAISRSMREREQSRSTSSTGDIRAPPEATETNDAPATNHDPADEIGVVLEIPQSQEEDNPSISTNVTYENIVTQTSRRRRDSDEDTLSTTINDEINRLSDDDDQDMACCEFYRSHWMGHFVSGILSGSLFIILGIIFIANLNDFPLYAGLTLIALGIVPCCMAFNRYRYVRLYEQERRRAVRRLNAIRRMHRRNRRDGGREHFSDCPPSYDNLGFDGDFEITVEAQSIPSSQSSSSFVLPSYDQFITEEKNIKAKYGSKRHNKDNIWMAIERENRGRKEQSRRQPNNEVIEVSNDVIHNVNQITNTGSPQENVPGGIPVGVSQSDENSCINAPCSSEDAICEQISSGNNENGGISDPGQNEREHTDTHTSLENADIHIHQNCENITVEIDGNDVASNDVADNLQSSA